MPAGFWLAVLGTALIGIGASLGWVKALGMEVSGQSPLLAQVAPVDPALVYAGVGVSALGLFGFGISRWRAWLLLCLFGAVGAAAVCLAAVTEAVSEVSRWGEGAWLLLAGALVSALGAVAAMARRPSAAVVAPSSPQTEASE